MDLAARSIDNDTRGWIMCIVSGIACVFGASVICVDFIVRLFPGKRNFRIQESNVFLACSLSLSFGVMLFSALYSMLPESKDYLEKDGWHDKPAGLVIMGCFVGGFFGIQIVSRVLHRHMPSHVVDCDHTHDDAPPPPVDEQSCNRSRRQSRVSRARRRQSRPPSSQATPVHSLKLDTEYVQAMKARETLGESTPLLSSTASPNTHYSGSRLKRHASARGEMAQRPTSPMLPHSRRATSDMKVVTRRPSMYDVQQRLVSFVKDTKRNCDEEGSCYGYTDPCGQECFKHVSVRASGRSSHSRSRPPTVLRTTTGPLYAQPGILSAEHEHNHSDEPVSPMYRTSRAASREPFLSATDEEPELETDDDYDHDHDHDHDHSRVSHSSLRPIDVESQTAEPQQHHHHVPANAFLNIGLQTSIAIALHKFPEGFITYATNHANPALGFNVFMALFVHNISEGFAMCLPLYMALGSRWRAIAWSAALGGLSQPMGAGVAALWFKLAQRSNLAPDALVYACLFAVTSGIMVSVGLQLFVEGLSLNHDRNLCIFFGFIGMAMLGLSNALFAAHTH
ncbi:vacuolar Zn-iron permease [Moelleriella libera RCEF 2490]|uniref:Vacuolar Zn-iron permease n=1 Tax=Moelleriella libera RCEF 2490 TaxID=1081109 RepID=A0A166PCP8_9HYPO|nr:vacuolar Zn-iron permease [Moelleriella libera RCEF 2490]